MCVHICLVVWSAMGADVVPPHWYQESISQYNEAREAVDFLSEIPDTLRAGLGNSPIILPYSPVTHSDPTATGWGLQATYRIVLVNTWADQVDAAFVTYYVEPARWSAKIAWVSPNWVRSRIIKPYSVGAMISSDGETMTLRFPGSADATLILGTTQRRRRLYTSDNYHLRNLFNAELDRQRWELNLTASLKASGHVVERQFGSTKLRIRSKVTSKAGAYDVVSQEVGRGLARRTFSDFRQFAGRAYCQTVRQEVEGHRFTRFGIGYVGYENDAPAAVGGSDGVATLYGARHTSLKWVKSTAGRLVPKAIQVTLGDDGAGMLLREATLLRHRCIPADELSSVVDVQVGGVKADRIHGIALKISRRFWRVKGDDHQVDERREFARQLANIGGDYPDEAKQLAAANRNLFMSIATDPPAGVGRSMRGYFRAVGALCGPETLFSSARSLETVLRAAGKPMLLPVVRREADAVASSEFEPEEHFRGLIPVGGTGREHFSSLCIAAGRVLKSPDAGEALRDLSIMMVVSRGGQILAADQHGAPSFVRSRLQAIEDMLVPRDKRRGAAQTLQHILTRWE